VRQVDHDLFEFPMEQVMYNRVLLSAVAFFAVLLHTASGQMPQGPGRWEPSISVSGAGEIQQKPDMAEIDVGVVTEAESAAAAVESNNEKMQALLQTLRQQGVAEMDIQTSNFQIMPRRRYPDPPEREQPPAITGYEVTNQVHIKVRDLARLGQILDAASEQGANQVYGIQFSISDRSEFVNQALRMALTDARQKAETLAAGADVQLGRVLTISESSTDFPRPMMGRAMQAEMADSVPVSPGTLTIRADVSVTYAIGKADDAKEAAAGRGRG
jgi:uncharacterized protein YggE